MAQPWACPAVCQRPHYGKSPARGAWRPRVPCYCWLRRAAVGGAQRLAARCCGRRGHRQAPARRTLAAAGPGSGPCPGGIRGAAQATRLGLRARAGLGVSVSLKAAATRPGGPGSRTRTPGCDAGRTAISGRPGPGPGSPADARDADDDGQLPSPADSARPRPGVESARASAASSDRARGPARPGPGSDLQAAQAASARRRRRGQGPRPGPAGSDCWSRASKQTRKLHLSTRTPSPPFPRPSNNPARGTTEQFCTNHNGTVLSHGYVCVCTRARVRVLAGGWLKREKRDRKTVSRENERVRGSRPRPATPGPAAPGCPAPAGAGSRATSPGRRDGVRVVSGRDCPPRPGPLDLILGPGSVRSSTERRCWRRRLPQWSAVAPH